MGYAAGAHATNCATKRGTRAVRYPDAPDYLDPWGPEEVDRHSIRSTCTQQSAPSTHTPLDFGALAPSNPVFPVSPFPSFVELKRQAPSVHGNNGGYNGNAAFPSFPPTPTLFFFFCWWGYGGLRWVVGVSLLAVRQIVHPSLVTEESLRQVNSSPASTGTSIGPTVPLYGRVPIVMKSHLGGNITERRIVIGAGSETKPATKRLRNSKCGEAGRGGAGSYGG